MANEFKIKNGLLVDQGGAQITGSLNVSGSILINGSPISGGTTNTGSLLTTASFSNPNLTFTKGDGTTFASSLTTLVPLNATSSSYAATAAYVNTLNQNVLITGSLTIGSSSLGASENTLTLGARDNGQEGGQIMFQAPGGTYTSASMLDNYANSTRLLRGTNAGSDAVVASWNMHTKQMQLPQYTNASSFTGSVSAFLAVDSGGNIITSSGSAGGGGGSTTINNNVDNYIITGTGTLNTINGESNLQFNGSSLTVTGQITSSGAIISQANGAMYFRGGDDAELWDINVANTVGIYGQQDATVASIKLGSGGGTISGKSSNIGIGTTNPTQGTLEVNGNVYATSFTGSLQGTAATASATQLQGGFPTSIYPGTYFYPNEPNAITQNIAASGQSDSTNIRYYPFVPSQDTKITGIGKHVRGTLSTNTGSYRLGIYASVQGNLGAGPVPLPGALVGDYGIVSFPGTTPAFVEITIAGASQPTLQKGNLYWLACSPSGSTTYANGPANGTQYNKFMGTVAPGATALGSAYVGLLQSSDGGAALPNPAATSSISLINSSGLVLAPFLKISGSILPY